MVLHHCGHREVLENRDSPQAAVAGGDLEPWHLLVHTECIRSSDFDKTIERIPASRFARKLSAVLDPVRATDAEYVVERGKQPVAFGSSCPGRVTVLKALSDELRDPRAP